MTREDIQVVYNRLLESLRWYYLEEIVAKIPSRIIRKLLLQRMKMSIGKNVSMFRGFKIRNPGGITIGEGCSIGPSVMLDGRRGLDIGKNVTLAYECMIWTLEHDFNAKDFSTKGGKVVIGDNAWICSRAIILPNVKIGIGAVVASGAVVTKDVEDYSVVGGVPAKKISERSRDLDYCPSYPLFFV